MTAKHDQWKYALIERHITKGIVHFVPPYTLFELELDNGCRYVGLAQQGHGDEWSERIGYDVAYGRAMQQAMKEFYKNAYPDHDIMAELMDRAMGVPQENYEQFVSRLCSMQPIRVTLLAPSGSG